MRHYRGFIIWGALIGIAVAVLAFPRFEINAFGGRLTRGNEDTLFGLTLGLDLQGGTHLVYRGKHADGSEPTSDDMEGVRRILESRINAFGVSESTVQLLGTPPNVDRVLIQMPGLEGASLTVAFAGNTVDPLELEEFVRTLEHPEANLESEVVIPDETNALVVMTLTLDELESERRDNAGSIITASEANRIRDAIEQRFPVQVLVGYVSQGEQAEELPNEEIDKDGVTGESKSEDSSDNVKQQEDAGEIKQEISGSSTLPTMSDIQSAMIAAGRPDAEVEEVPLQDGVGFMITLVGLKKLAISDDGTVIPGDQQRIREELEALGKSSIQSVGQIVQWTVGGGVQEAKRLIGQTAVLEFRERDCGDIANPPEGMLEVEWFDVRCEDPRFYIDKAVELSGKNLVDAFPDVPQGASRPVVTVVLDEAGSAEFFNITDRIARTGGRLAIFLDGEELIAPTASSGIAGGRAIIQGPDFTAERVRTISIQLKSGSLPVSLELIQERNVDATLGADSLRKSVIAGAIGLGLVLVFMITYYKGPGVVASVALLMYAVILMAIFKGVPVTLTLSGAAALVLSLGVAVDANILIAERTKEELRTGRTLFSAINNGFDRAWPSIRDSNVSTIITCVVLFWFGDRFGTSIMQGFALTLGIGVLLSMLTAFFASRMLMRSLARTKLGDYLTFFVPVGEARAEQQSRG